MRIYLIILILNILKIAVFLLVSRWQLVNVTFPLYDYLHCCNVLNGTKDYTNVVRKIRRVYTRVGTLIVATIYLQLIQNGYMFRSFTVLHCSHQHCVQPVASDVEVVGYL